MDGVQINSTTKEAALKKTNLSNASTSIFYLDSKQENGLQDFYLNFQNMKYMETYLSLLCHSVSIWSFGRKENPQRMTYRFILECLWKCMYSLYALCIWGFLNHRSTSETFQLKKTKSQITLFKVNVYNCSSWRINTGPFKMFILCVNVYAIKLNHNF